jgi:glutathione S-transferase
MSTKLNADELAATFVRMDDKPTGRVHCIWWGHYAANVHETVAGKTLNTYRSIYAAAIREVAQPIADQRDELLAELKAVEAIIVQPVRSGAEAELMASEVQALQHRISAAIAKCTQKP